MNAVPHAEVETLLDRAFGQDRHGRTAYMIRGDGIAIQALSFAAVSGDVLLGSIQCWPIALMTAQAALPLVMVGPVAVAPGHQGDGIGRALVARALEVAATGDLGDALMLIGDPDYYGRFFGFSAERTAAWRAPGPVERHRLLALGGRTRRRWNARPAPRRSRLTTPQRGLTLRLPRDFTRGHAHPTSRSCLWTPSPILPR
ncbi:N-acetyltransferase [Sphingomonas aerolata]|uniref:GNAT family N-acetyltransferase n=1 Tax=Sphingomonas aerolata TaxID=185951 RepID=UPI002FE35485